MDTINSIPCIAFKGHHCIASGDLAQVARRTKETLDKNPNAAILIFNGFTSEQIEVDFRGTVEDVLMRLPKPAQPSSRAGSDQTDEKETRGPGRPKLGVVSREITLLPRHWDWLNTQPGGASIALRKLVEKARHENAVKDQLRQAQDSTYKFMLVMAGNLPNYEEANRALFAGNENRFHELIESWPADIRDHVQQLAQKVFHVISLSDLGTT